MSDQDWGDLEALPPQKSGAPRWLWFCGGGCLVMVLLAMAATWGTYSWVKEGRDVEVQWEHLEEVLPHDGRTAGHDLAFGQTVPMMGTEIFVFTPVGLMDSGRSEPEPAASDSDAEGDADSDADGDAGQAEDEEREHPMFVVLIHLLVGQEDESLPDFDDPDDAERIPMRVQGRDLVAYQAEGQMGPRIPGVSSGPQSTVAVELTDDETSGRLIALFVRDGSTEPVTQAEIAEFLTPFHVGPDR